MAILLESIETSKKFIFIGIGFGMYQSKKPNWAFGDLIADIDEGNEKIIFGCNEKGEILSSRTSAVRIHSVDGKSPKEILSPFSEE